ECFGKYVDEFDKVTVLFGEMQLKQEDQSYAHASNELHLHVVHIVPSKHEADQHWKCVQKLGINLKLIQWHLVDVHIIE
ncbi:hypothetical protein Tco_0697921, partial [Tanacetum coccineum]